MGLPKGFHKEVIETRESIDDTDFSQLPIENTVDISPLNSGGSNFKTHVLVEKSSSKLAYKPSIGGVLFSLLFLVTGLGIIIYNLIIFLELTTNQPKLLNFILLAFGTIFAFAGGYIAMRIFKPRIFDKQIGLYYKAYKVHPHDSDNNLKNQIQLNSITAIQIIGEIVSDDDGSYNSFELNLVLIDGSRRNVVDHGNLRTIIDDAHIISDFLNIPIWHAES